MQPKATRVVKYSGQKSGGRTSALYIYNDGKRDEHNQAKNLVEISRICRCDCFCRPSQLCVRWSGLKKPTKRIAVQRDKGNRDSERLQAEEQTDEVHRLFPKRLPANICVGPNCWVGNDEPSQNFSAVFRSINQNLPARGKYLRVTRQGPIEHQQQGTTTPSGVGKGERFRQHPDTKERGDRVEQLEFENVERRASFVKRLWHSPSDRKCSFQQGAVSTIRFPVSFEWARGAGSYGVVRSISRTFFSLRSSHTPSL